MPGRIIYTTREIAEQMQTNGANPRSLFYDTSSQGPFGIFFSPFTIWADPIPVPGMPGYVAHSVEGIWQGLKVIDGRIDISLFEKRKPKKRKHTPYSATKFSFNEGTVGVVEARHFIYVPAYEFVYKNRVPKQVKDNIIAARAAGADQFFYDVDSNPNINDPTQSYAHSALLVELIQQEIKNRKL